MAIIFNNGYIADTPATTSDDVRVSVPNLTQADRVVYGPLSWKPQVNANGAVIAPTLGDKALIAVDDSVDGAQWIVSWSGSRVIVPAVVELNNIPVLVPGISGQARAGRRLLVTDFTTLLGLGVPAGLWNFLGNANDSSGNGRNLTNTTAAVQFGSGHTGSPNEAALFTGNNVMGLFLNDTSGGPLNLANGGSWGCWFRCAKQGGSVRLMARGTATSPNRCWNLAIDGATGRLRMDLSIDGTALGQFFGQGSGPADDRWHFAVGTYDGVTGRIYCDGVLDGIGVVGAPLVINAQAFNIGNEGINAVAGTGSGNFPLAGRVASAFVTPDVLNDDQVRLLYAAAIPHGFGRAPDEVQVSVRRRRRGGVPSGFPSTPLRLYNFTGGTLTDSGSAGVNLAVASGSPIAVAGIDGQTINAQAMKGGWFSAADTGLPTTTCTFGCWFISPGIGGTSYGIMGWGTTGAARELYLGGGSGSLIMAQSASISVSSPGAYIDGQPHFAVVVVDASAPDGLLVKLYVDAALVNTNITAPANVALAGAGGLVIGNLRQSAVYQANLVIDSAFITNVALTYEQIAAIFASGSLLIPSPTFVEPGIVEYADATNLYVIADRLQPQDQLNFKVRAA